MELPIRSKQHISESKSYRIFRNNIPEHWIVREVTERDYGIDCYVELVDNKKRLRGDLISFQIKANENISWNRQQTYSLSGISISNTNYWYLFSVPVFICLIDLEEEKVYYLAVRKYIREHFDIYQSKLNMPYVFRKDQKLDTDANKLKTFLYQYFFDRNYELYVKDIIHFISSYVEYIEFLDSNIGRDCFMGVEWSRVIYIRNIYNLLNSLCIFFDIKWDLDDFNNYKIKGQKVYGDYYELYEEQLTEIAEKSKDMMKPLFLKIKNHICEIESTFWLVRDSRLSNYLYNTTDDCEFPI